MQILGRPGAFNLETQGITGQEQVFWNLTSEELIEHAVNNGECVLSSSGAMIVNTGKFTGRSPNDKYIVDYGSEYDKEIDWGKINHPISPEKATGIFNKIQKYLQNKGVYIQDLFIGSHPRYSQSLRVLTETAWHSLFCQNLFLNFPDRMVNTSPGLTIIHVPNFFAQPKLDGVNSGTFVILDFEKKLILIGGTAYAGEIKKAVFTFMNRILPALGVLPMHCSANLGEDNNSALFFGLSGTGKTTLSSDAHRRLIGDDEHGWCDDGLFNFEGGCYAKTISLKKEFEPLIWKASRRSGSVLENVAYNPNTLTVDFDDASITENARAAYPLKFIPDYVVSGRAVHPTNIFFLTADAFGVLPPLAKLNIDQAMFFFLSGFTAKLAGTELGLPKEPKATFSACFAAPFLPLRPQIYAELLKSKLARHQTNVWLLNTGWSGGQYGVGSRIKLSYTRAMTNAVLHSQISESLLQLDEVFHLAIPTKIPGVPEDLLNPIKTWKVPAAYLQQAKQLLKLFEENEKSA